MKLTEILDSHVRARERVVEPHLFSTMAPIGGRNIYFSAANTNSKDNIWTIQFSERTAQGLKGVTHNYGNTGGGHELEVFSFVLNSLRSFTHLYNPDEITFLSSLADNRSALYSKLVQKVTLPGYSFEGVRDVGNFDEFTIVKNTAGKGHALR